MHRHFETNGPLGVWKGICFVSVKSVIVARITNFLTLDELPKSTVTLDLKLVFTQQPCDLFGGGGGKPPYTDIEMCKVVVGENYGPCSHMWPVKLHNSPYIKCCCVRDLCCRLCWSVLPQERGLVLNGPYIWLNKTK